MGGTKTLRVEISMVSQEQRPTGNRRRRSCIAIAAIVAGSFAGCGGRAAGGGNNTDAGRSVCPPVPPPLQSGCMAEGVLCEYGDEWDPGCSSGRACVSAVWQDWSVLAPKPIGKCPSAAPVVAANPTACPNARSAVPDRQQCTTEVYCNYSDGSQCNCSQTPGAGDSWRCLDGIPICDTPRPKLGTACAIDDHACALSRPSCLQPVMQCQNGLWGISTFAPPGVDGCG
jgi:hypothetical protein